HHGGRGWIRSLEVSKGRECVCCPRTNVSDIGTGMYPATRRLKRLAPDAPGIADARGVVLKGCALGVVVECPASADTTGVWGRGGSFKARVTQKIRRPSLTSRAKGNCAKSAADRPGFQNTSECHLSS